MQSETSQFLNHPLSFGNSMRCDVTQVVSPALFVGKLSGRKKKTI